MADDYLQEVFSELEKKDLIPKPEAGEDRWAYLPRCSEDLTGGGFASALAGRMCSMKWEQTRANGKAQDMEELNRKYGRTLDYARVFRKVWEVYTDEPLAEIEFVETGSYLTTKAAVVRSSGENTILVQPERNSAALLEHLFHELGHVHLGLHKGAVRVDLATARADLQDGKAAYDYDEAEEDACNEWAEAKRMLWEDPMAYVVGAGDWSLFNETAAEEAGQRKASTRLTRSKQVDLSGVVAANEREAAKAAVRARMACKALGSPSAALKAINAKYGAVQRGETGSYRLEFTKALPADIDTADIDRLSVPAWLKKGLKRGRGYLAWLAELQASGAWTPAAA